MNNIIEVMSNSDLFNILNKITSNKTLMHEYGLNYLFIACQFKADP